MLALQGLRHLCPLTEELGGELLDVPWIGSRRISARGEWAIGLRNTSIHHALSRADRPMGIRAHMGKCPRDVGSLVRSSEQGSRKLKFLDIDAFIPPAVFGPGAGQSKLV